MITYVCTVYFGPRRLPDERYESDCHFYVNKHIERLRNLKFKDITEFIFVINRSDSPLFAFPFAIDGKPVSLIYRDNIGLSYGALDHAVRHITSNDYVFFIEDDYVPAIDNFDEVFVAKMLEDKKNGYVCSLYQWDHAAIANGLLKVRVLQTIQFQDGRLPYADNSDYLMNELVGQIGLSGAIASVGYKTVDLAGVYRVPFRDIHNVMQVYGNPNGETIIEPI